MKNLVEEAVNHFNNNMLFKAEELFIECGEKYGQDLFKINGKLINFKIKERFLSYKDINEDEDPYIYYCTPVMNRLEDLQATLFHNLEILSKFKNVKLIINIFDHDTKTEEWIRSNFSYYLALDLLRINSLIPLPYWHFSWAKNSFAPFIDQHGIYSSLDGDNYLTIEEIARTKQIFWEYGDVVIHHFTGNWGDGSSGRVTISSKHYIKYGYENNILPRQFDEMTLIMQALVRENVPYVCRCEANIFNKSWFLKSFQEVENWNPTTIYANLGEVISPENPKGDGYVKNDEKLDIYTQINANYSLHTLSSSAESKRFFQNNLVRIKQKILKSNTFMEIAPKLVETLSKSTTISDQITLYAVIKDDKVFLDNWLHHYRLLGVERFILIDDNSQVPLSTQNLGDDVFVLKPRVGDFKNFKTLWISSALKLFQKEDSVCICVDSDEFVDLHSYSASMGNKSYSDLQDLGNNSTSLKKYKRIPSLLIDLMPKSIDEDINNDNFIEKMVYCCYQINDTDSSKDAYRLTPSIKWGFDHNWQISYKFDLRYHLYETFDCLRKFPIFIYTNGMELNQGFHDIKFNDKSSSIQSDDEILLIRHYKMMKVISSDSDKVEKDFESYFDRTKENLLKIYNTKDVLSDKWMNIDKINYSKLKNMSII